MAPAQPVCVCVAGTGTQAAATLDAVLASVPAGTPVFVGAQAAAPAGARALAGAEDPLEILVRSLAEAGRADVAVVTAGSMVFPGWLDALADAAATDTTVASASAMTAATPWAPATPPGLAAADAAAAMSRRSARVRPRVPEPTGPVVLLRRPALDALGAPDPELGDLMSALVDWGERCTAMGFSHVLADDVLVTPPAAASLTEQAATELQRRWPHRESYHRVAGGSSALQRAIAAAGRDFAPLTVTFDGRAFGPGRAGTQVHGLELATALLRTGRVALRVLVPPDLTDEAGAALATAGPHELLGYEEAIADHSPPASDIVHRPSQVFSADDLRLLVPLGRRIVLTHQDLIAYRIPGYHDTPEHWERYRSVTRHALGSADHVVFFSHHALADALADDLVDPELASVVPIGVDHRATANAGATPPAALVGSERGRHLLCLGTDLRHKQRPFAIRLFAELRRRGWSGRLVLAGPHVSHGSSADDEHRLLATDPELAAQVTDLGPVNEPERAWLMEHAAAIVYPTLYEGFGLLPFEAAEAGVPCLFASQTSLRETLPPELASLVPWDVDASAAASLQLLADGPARTAHVAALRAAAERFRWDRTANALVDRYEDVLSRPSREARTGPRERLVLEEQLEVSNRARDTAVAEYRSMLGEDGLSLVAPGGVLDRRNQRALLAFAARPALRRPLFWALRLAYRVGHRRRPIP